MKKNLMKAGDFCLVSEEPISLGGIKYLKRVYISEEYGKKLEETRKIQDGKLYFMKVMEYNNDGKTLPISTQFLYKAGNSIDVIYKADISDKGRVLDINTLSLYKALTDKTIECLNTLYKYF